MNPVKLLLDLLYPPKCPFCGRVLERGEEGWCAPCREDLPWHRYKFQGGQGHAWRFGALMAQCLRDRWAGPADLVTWAPLHPRRKRERGYDQAELLARRVGELCGLPVECTLEKVRSTAVQSQAGEDEARWANVQGA